MATAPEGAALSLNGDRAAVHAAALAYRAEHPEITYSQAVKAVTH
jgi:hypothetical protein